MPDLVFVAFLTGMFAHIPILGINVLPLPQCAASCTRWRTVSTRKFKTWLGFLSFLHESRGEISVFNLTSFREAGDGGRGRGALWAETPEGAIRAASSSSHWLHIRAEDRPEPPTCVTEWNSSPWLAFVSICSANPPQSTLTSPWWRHLYIIYRMRKKIICF